MNDNARPFIMMNECGTLDSIPPLESSTVGRAQGYEVLCIVPTDACPGVNPPPALLNRDTDNPPDIRTGARAEP